MPLETRPLNQSFAREVVGLRLWEPQDDATIDELRALWARHPVLAFRPQAVSEDELAYFSARFGPLERTVRTDWASPARTEVTLISNLKDAQARPIGGLGDGELQWHSDQSYMLQPATGAMLYALELPPQGFARQSAMRCICPGETRNPMGFDSDQCNHWCSVVFKLTCDAADGRRL